MDWKHGEFFRPEEVLSPNGLAMFRKGNLLLQNFAMENLTAFRRELNTPFSINHAGLQYRGYRSSIENAKVGGAQYGRHEQGIAFDITMYDLSLCEQMMQTIMFTAKQIALHKNSPEPGKHSGVRALGVYPSKNFCHNDYRALPSKGEEYMVVWNGSSPGVAILDERVLRSSPEAILIFLQKQLGLPKTWRIG